MQNQCLYAKKYQVLYYSYFYDASKHPACLTTSLVPLDITYQPICYSALLTNKLDGRNLCPSVLHVQV